jgi:hypothetical protein
MRTPKTKYYHVAHKFTRSRGKEAGKQEAGSGKQGENGC